ncbi:hypothetical protein [Variovorax sp. JS1663]|uniref:hypothetical protein n=1 Tax=Variovorax sp. JS1663 TaxID=1851577 RepID=UPI0011802082|nr:hypothetical protein [Variovorax sp. JS1663]
MHLIAGLRRHQVEEAVQLLLDYIDGKSPKKAELAEPSEAQLVCYEAYQVVGSMLSDLRQFGSEIGDKILDNLSAAKLVHKDVLPWPPFTPEKKAPAAPLPEGTIEDIINGLPGGLDGYLKTWGWLQFARGIEKALGWAWRPEFDAVSQKQEQLAYEFCAEINGLGGSKGSPPDPIRLLEMAQALYEAEREDAACTG